MFQFSIRPSTTRNVLERVADAISHGFTWIEVEGEINDDLYDAVEKECKDNGIIMTITDDIELLKTRKCHGILLPLEHEQDIVNLREQLGGHPIVGLSVNSGTEIGEVRHLDSDYIAFNCENYKEACDFIEKHGNRFTLPVVARSSNLTFEEANQLIEKGFNGICIKCRC